MAEFDVSAITPRERYKLTLQSVVPRPIAWVSTLDLQGRGNLAPFSFFNAFSSNPPIFGLGIGRRAGVMKDTLANLVETGECVINFVSDALSEPMNETAGEHPRGVDEFDVAGLTRAPSQKVRPPRIAESPVSWECVLYDAIPLARSRLRPEEEAAQNHTTLVLLEGVHVHVRDDVFADRESLYLDADRLAPLARLGGKDYWRRGERFSMTRPRVE